MQEKYILFYQLANRGLNTLEHLLQKAKDYSVENNVNEEELLEARLAPDMFTFKRQVDIYTDGVLGGVYRLARMDKPQLADTVSIADLQARVEAARDLLGKINPREISDFEGIKIALPWMGGMHFEVSEFLDNFLFMNNIFHLATAYNILRMKGVVLGKPDFLGPLEMKSE
jgi:uncharacterized protein